MKQIALLLIVVLFTMSGCKKDEPVNPDYVDIFVGTWVGTSYTNAGTTYDLTKMKDVYFHFIFRSVGVNTVELKLTALEDGQTYSQVLGNLTISKSGDVYNLKPSGTTASTGSLKYTSTTGEMTFSTVDDNGLPLIIIFKK
ncbi:hypothetical protein VB264_19510 [Arcicella aquatica]|uniref:Lipocalin-like domain-containing protein n=1 Tax=Arcicella aquatica TaxID=217141 RepID=A0ABU5QSB9_9BACT|nr:hypothetical protein [Arcicella aquatica]MEA5259995.1 hypothetical protein [Arcicella aquatica]